MQGVDIATHCTTPHISFTMPPLFVFRGVSCLCRCTLQHTLQHTATHCNTLQHTATHCHTLSLTFGNRSATQSHGDVGNIRGGGVCFFLSQSHNYSCSGAPVPCAGAHCNTHCNTLQNTLQHTLQRTLQHTQQHTLQHTRVPVCVAVCVAGC